jgi:hypothetical protein
LEEFLGEGSGFATADGEGVPSADSAGEMSEDEQQQMRQVEDLVAGCMRDRGFEYVPIDPAESHQEDPFAAVYALPPDEFAREYGYGISTLTTSSDSSEDEVKDPNMDIREGLSEAAREEYDRALWGETVDATAVGSDAVEPTSQEGGEPGNSEDQSCYELANEEVYGEGAYDEQQDGADLSEFDGLFEDMQAVRWRIENDPRVAEAIRTWSDCLAAAGHGGFTTPEAAQQDVIERMMDLYGSTTVNEGTDAEAQIMNMETDIDEAALRELHDYEVDLASADYECQQQHYVEVQREVALALEEQFVEEHRAELERYRDTAGYGLVGHTGGLG